jgi:hypothetical protein
VAAEILQVIDFRREIQAINAVVRRVTSLYAAHKLSAANAKAALVQVGLPAAQADRILEIWEALADQPVRLPSVSDIGKAVKYGTLTQAQALDEIEALGYQGRDAQIMLSANSELAIAPLLSKGDGVGG